MTPFQRLAALLFATGTLVAGGVTYLVLSPRPGVTLEDLRDAGIDARCNPALVECDMRLREACRTKPDGGRRPRYLTVRMGGYLCERDAGYPILVKRLARCLEPIDDSFCRVVEADGCSDSEACGDDVADSNDEDSSPQPRFRAWLQSCACRTPGTVCARANPDGGTAINIPLGVTWPYPVGGAGCVRKACVEVAGEQGQSWPDECRLADGGMP